MYLIVLMCQQAQVYDVYFTFGDFCISQCFIIPYYMILYNTELAKSAVEVLRKSSFCRSLKSCHSVVCLMYIAMPPCGRLIYHTVKIHVYNSRNIM